MNVIVSDKELKESDYALLNFDPIRYFTHLKRPKILVESARLYKNNYMSNAKKRAAVLRIVFQVKVSATGKDYLSKILREEAKINLRRENKRLYSYTRHVAVLACAMNEYEALLKQEI